jgi:dephospho-CoA kinase
MVFRMGPKPVIGLVGGIGAGKSSAARCFAGRGGVVIDADIIGHTALKQPDIVAKIVGRWGDRVRKDDGSLDRRAIAQIVFANPPDRTALEEMVFPYIRNLCNEKIASAQRDPAVRFIVLDAAVMLEAGWNENTDWIVYVDALKELRLARVTARSGWSEDDLSAREAAQWTTEMKKERADEILTNDASFEELQLQVDQLLAKWKLLNV